MSGGGSEKTKFEAPGYVRPTAASMVRRADVLSQQPYQAYGGQRLAGFNPAEQQAFTGITNRATAGDPGIQAGSNMLAQTLSGAFLNNNPYINQMVNTAQGDIADQYRYATGPMNAAHASASGSFDNTGRAGKDMMDRFGMTRAMGDVENQIRGGAYQFERGNQMAALDPALAYGNQGYSDMAQLAGVGQQQRALEQQGLDVGYQQFQEQREDPQQKLDFLRNMVQTAQGQFGTTTGSSKLPWWTMPAAMTGSAMGGK